MEDLRMKEDDWVIYRNDNPSMKIRHRHEKDGSIGWGSLYNTPFYVKTLRDSYKYFEGIEPYKASDSPIDDLRLAYVHGTGLCAALLKEGNDLYAIVVDAELFGEVSGDYIDTSSFINIDYHYIGYVFLSDLYGSHDKSLMTAAALLYVPFAKGPQGSRLPIVWATTGEKSSDRLTIDNMLSTSFMQGENDSASALYFRLKDMAPPIEMLQSYEQRRYIPMMVWFNNLDADLLDIVYNRNHVAYNGTVSSAVAMLPILMWNSIYCQQEIESETISDFLRGKDVSIAVHLKGSTDEPIADESAPTPTSQRELVEDNKGINALLRAAGRANIKFKE